MKKISANLFFIKKIFPVVWFGFLGLFILSALLYGHRLEHFPFLIVPCLMAVFGYFLMKKIVWDLMDEVYDCGESLLVKNAGEQEMVPLSNIMHVNAVTLMNPPRITLRLVRPGKFGSDISFSPPPSWFLNPFAKNQVAEDLIVRVDRARGQRTC
jgi:hypothetical protein